MTDEQKRERGRPKGTGKLGGKKASPMFRIAVPEKWLPDLKGKADAIREALKQFVKPQNR